MKIDLLRTQQNATESNKMQQNAMTTPEEESIR